MTERPTHTVAATERWSSRTHCWSVAPETRKCWQGEHHFLSSPFKLEPRNPKSVFSHYLPSWQAALSVSRKSQEYDLRFTSKSNQSACSHQHEWGIQNSGIRRVWENVDFSFLASAVGKHRQWDWMHGEQHSISHIQVNHIQASLSPAPCYLLFEICPLEGISPPMMCCTIEPEKHSKTLLIRVSRSDILLCI